MTEDAEAVLSDVADPGDEYGPVPLWWWDGDKLDEERMTEQLEAVADGGVSAVCFIQKHPTGRDGDSQKYFTDEWWDPRARGPRVRATRNDAMGPRRDLPPQLAEPPEVLATPD